MVSRSISRTILERYYTERISISMEQVASSSISSMILIKHFLNTSMITMIMKSSKRNLHCAKKSILLWIYVNEMLWTCFLHLSIFLKIFIRVTKRQLKMKDRSVEYIRNWCRYVVVRWKLSENVLIDFAFFYAHWTKHYVFYHLLNNSKKKEYWKFVLIRAYDRHQFINNHQ